MEVWEELATRSFEEYPLGFIPGPTTVHPEIGAIYSKNYGSADMENQFFEMYEETQQLLGNVLQITDANGLDPTVTSDNKVIIQSGEAMICLWGALKSVIQPNDKVLAISTGLFGYGIGEMAQQIGAQVEYVKFEYNEAVHSGNVNAVREMAEIFRPKLITLVHCETPSGTLNDPSEVGKIAESIGAMFYVDFVSSGAATPVKVKDWKIDLGMLGTQKALSLLPDLGILTVSNKAWSEIEKVKYVGYDALLPWKDATKNRYFPYTHNWHAVSALNFACKKLLKEGMNNVYSRHEQVSQYCRQRVKAMGLKLYPVVESTNSPSVTAILLPENWTWQQLDSALRQQGVVVGNNYGPLKNKVFRLGHMGLQADMTLATKVLDILENVIKSK